MIEALNIKAERVESADRFAEEIALNLRRLPPRFSYSNSTFVEDLIYIYFVSSIHSSCRLDPFKSRSNFFSFINFVSAMREGEEKSCFIRFEDCTKTLHKIRTGRCNFSKEVFEPNLTFCIES